MSVYTVHVPPARAQASPPDPERFVFVRDGFSFWAFLLGPLWMLWHRLWLVLIGYLVLVILLQAHRSYDPARLSRGVRLLLDTRGVIPAAPHVEAL